MTVNRPTEPEVGEGQYEHLLVEEVVELGKEDEYIFTYIWVTDDNWGSTFNMGTMDKVNGWTWFPAAANAVWFRSGCHYQTGDKLLAVIHD